MAGIAEARQFWHLVAAISGASAVGAAAYGAHGFRPKTEPEFWKEVYQRGNQFHLLHSLLLAAAPLARRPNLVGGLTSVGILLFSGTCYAIAVGETRKTPLMKITPIGGFTLIGAWIALAL